MPRTKQFWQKKLRGIYVLGISVSKCVSVNIGALGTMSIRRGLYSYVGSAQGNLEARIGRHLRKEKVKFWHIDYLLDNDEVAVSKVYYKQAAKAEECRLSEKMAQVGIPVEGFGSSDCRCKSHLFRIQDAAILRKLMWEAEMKPVRTGF